IGEERLVERVGRWPVEGEDANSARLVVAPHGRHARAACSRALPTRSTARRRPPCIDLTRATVVGGPMPRRVLVPVLAALVVAACAPRARTPPVSPRVASAIGAVAVIPFRVGGELDPTASFSQQRDDPPGPDNFARQI